MTVTDPYARNTDDYREPPRGFWATARHLGPGMILVGSIVGSGELILTTKLGAMAGFVLLWFVLLSCFVKAVVQAELTRHTIASGQTFLTVFNAMPGPAAPRPGWLTLPWMAVLVLASIVAVAAFVRLDPASQTTTAALLIGACVGVVCVVAAWILRRSGEESRRPVRSKMNWFTWIWLAATLLIFVN